MGGRNLATKDSIMPRRKPIELNTATHTQSDTHARTHTQGDEIPNEQCVPSDSSEPLLLTAFQAAAMLKVAVRTWRNWHAMGRIPQPIRIGRKTYWRPADLRAWVAAGCPDRATWAVMRA
jgi:hypothetical protein